MTVERLARALANIVGPSHDRTESSPGREEQLQGPQDSIGSEGPDVPGHDRRWECAGCGSIHVENPEKCSDCGYTVFSWVRSRDPTLADEWDDDPDRPVSTAIVNEVAEREGVPPVECPPLYGAVDPDALDAVVEATESGTVTFSYCGYTVTVECDGTVRVRDGT